MATTTHSAPRVMRTAAFGVTWALALASCGRSQSQVGDAGLGAANDPGPAGRRATARLVIILDVSASGQHRRATEAELPARRCAELEASLSRFAAGQGTRAVEAVVLQTGDSATAGNPVQLWAGSINPPVRGLATEKKRVLARAGAIAEAVHACQRSIRIGDRTPLLAALRAGDQTLRARCGAEPCARQRLELHSDGIETDDPSLASHLAARPSRRAKRGKARPGTPSALPVVPFAAEVEVSMCGLAESVDATAVDRESLWRKVIVADRLSIDAICPRAHLGRDQDPQRAAAGSQKDDAPRL